MDPRKVSTAEIMSATKVSGKYVQVNHKLYYSSDSSRCPFNEDQLKNLKEVFIMFDTDKSGTISRTEFAQVWFPPCLFSEWDRWYDIQMIQALGFLAISPQQLNRLFDDADTDHNGTISFEEVRRAFIFIFFF